MPGFFANYRLDGGPTHTLMQTIWLPQTTCIQLRIDPRGDDHSPSTARSYSISPLLPSSGRPKSIQILANK